MPCPFANELNVHALHQEVTNVGVPQPVKRDRCHLGSGYKSTKRFGKRVGIHRLTIEARKYKSMRIAPKSELQPLFELRLIALPQGLDRDSWQRYRSPACSGFR